MRGEDRETIELEVQNPRKNDLRYALLRFALQFPEGKVRRRATSSAIRELVARAVSF
jgi:hypothetical protein